VAGCIRSVPCVMAHFASFDDKPLNTWYAHPTCPNPIQIISASHSLGRPSHRKNNTMKPEIEIQVRPSPNSLLMPRKRHWSERDEKLRYQEPFMVATGLPGSEFQYYTSTKDCPLLCAETEAHMWDLEVPNEWIPVSGDKEYLTRLGSIVSR
jgi:hypothetical protein